MFIFSFLSFVFPSKITRYTDINMEDFKCPIFLGCIICVTGLDGPERKRVQQLTVKHGGQYMGQLKMNECTHLIVQEPKGKSVFPKWTNAKFSLLFNILRFFYRIAFASDVS